MPRQSHFSPPCGGNFGFGILQQASPAAVTTWVGQLFVGGFRFCPRSDFPLPFQDFLVWLTSVDVLWIIRGFVQLGHLLTGNNSLLRNKSWNFVGRKVQLGWRVARLVKSTSLGGRVSCHDRFLSTAMPITCSIGSAVA